MIEFLFWCMDSCSSPERESVTRDATGENQQRRWSIVDDDQGVHKTMPSPALIGGTLPSADNVTPPTPFCKTEPNESAADAPPAVSHRQPGAGRQAPGQLGQYPGYDLVVAADPVDDLHRPPLPGALDMDGKPGKLESHFSANPAT